MKVKHRKRGRYNCRPGIYIYQVVVYCDMGYRYGTDYVSI